MELSNNADFEGEILPEEPEVSARRVRSIPRGFSSASRVGSLLTAGRDGLGMVWVTVQWDGESNDAKFYLLGRDIELA